MDTLSTSDFLLFSLILWVQCEFVKVNDDNLRHMHIKIAEEIFLKITFLCWFITSNFYPTEKFWENSTPGPIEYHYMFVISLCINVSQGILIFINNNKPYNNPLLFYNIN